jgi:SPP1 gp7 family putative phage head morphogenesis protein
MPYVRHLAQSPYVEMAISTIIDEIASIPWDIVPTKGMEDQADETEIQHIKNLFENPNTNNESFRQVFVDMPVRDILEINSGIQVKVFNMKEELVEIVTRAGENFTKNPDIHGMYTNREEILLPKQISDNPQNYFEMTPGYAREAAAYFQYGWIAGPMPIPFGKREIVWLEQMKRTDDHYGYSKVQLLANTLQTMIYYIESDLEYYNNNNVPKGVLGFDGGDSDGITAFKEQWKEMQRTKDEFGNWKKLQHQVPIMNSIPSFTKIEFSSEEMQLIEKQKWYSKLIWAMFGVTPTEMGYTEDAKGSSNQIVQSKVSRKKAINPMIALLEFGYNSNIVSEFGYMGTMKTEKGKVIEMPKYQFKFLTFDIDEERAKWELYKLQTESGGKTWNEIRTDEGLEEVEWGDEPPRQWMGASSINNFGDDYFDREKVAQDTRNNNKIPDTEEPNKDKKKPDEKAIETKPMGEYSNFADCVRKNQDKKDPEAYCAAIMHRIEGKTKENPLVLRENERPTSHKRLESAINYVLDANKRSLIELLEQELKESQLTKIKGVEDVIKKIKDILSVAGLSAITYQIVRNNYLKSWDEAEKAMDKNFVPETHAIDFLSDYTFDNIKGMNEDIENKLKQELSRGYMDGEGVAKLKKRVEKVFDVGKNRSEMIARSEVTRASNFGKLNAYKKAGEKGTKVWITHIDDRTSEICKRLDGQEVDINDNFKDSKTGWEGQAPPAHPRCRSGISVRPE